MLGDLRGKAFFGCDAVHDPAMKAGAMLRREPERVGGFVEDGVPVDETVECFQVALLDAGLHRPQLDAFILGKRDVGLLFAAGALAGGVAAGACAQRCSMSSAWRPTPEKRPNCGGRRESACMEDP